METQISVAYRHDAPPPDRRHHWNKTEARRAARLSLQVRRINRELARPRMLLAAGAAGAAA